MIHPPLGLPTLSDAEKVREDAARFVANMRMDDTVLPALRRLNRVRVRLFLPGLLGVVLIPSSWSVMVLVGAVGCIRRSWRGTRKFLVNAEGHCSASRRRESRKGAVVAAILDAVALLFAGAVALLRAQSAAGVALGVVIVVMGTALMPLVVWSVKRLRNTLDYGRRLHRFVLPPGSDKHGEYSWYLKIVDGWR